MVSVMTWRCYPAFALLWLLSLPPLRVHYFLSDWVLFPMMYHMVRYRRKLVARQMAECLPELDVAERKVVERRFYHTLCDYMVEIIKMMTISPAEIKRRVQFVGIDKLQQTMLDEGKPINLAYLGHLGNWEWFSSAVLNLYPCFNFAQVYHKLHNHTLDQLFLHNRERLGGHCVAMQDTLRHVLNAKQKGQYEIVGFIADQCPKWEAMHQWCTFLHHDTSFFIGAEVIGKRVDAVICYLDISRPKRGYYTVDVKIITTNPNEYSDFKLTECYAHLLEQNIRQNPHLWLWTHDRWKRTHEEWERRQRVRVNDTKGSLH